MPDAKLGASKGGKASAAALTPEERKERARQAIAARWAAEKGNEPTGDHKRVLALLNKKTPAPMRVSSGPAGQRRRRAIEQLVAAKKIRVVADRNGTVEAILLQRAP